VSACENPLGGSMMKTNRNEVSACSKPTGFEHVGDD